MMYWIYVARDQENWRVLLKSVRNIRVSFTGIWLGELLLATQEKQYPKK